MIRKIIDALEMPEKKRLGRVKLVCRDILLSIPAYKNKAAKQVVEIVVEKGEDYLQMAQYTLYNIYYGFSSNKIDPNNDYYLEVVKYLTKMLNGYDSAEIKGCALGALTNLGPHAIRYAMNSKSPDPILEALSSRSDFLRSCAKEAIDNIPTFQPEGKPMLTSKDIATVRGHFNNDVPAYQESVHYTLFVDGDKEIKDVKKKVEGEIVDSETIEGEDGMVQKQTIIIPGQKQ